MQDALTLAAEPETRARVGLTRTVVLFALLHAACRFVPLPLMDDWLKIKALEQVVRRTLARHQRSYDPDCVSLLWTTEPGCVAGCLMSLPAILLELVLFPIRKVLAWLGALSGVARDVTLALLLARTVERVLARGGLATDDTRALGQDALVVRSAFDQALRQSDMSVLRAAVASVFASRKGLLAALARSAGKVLARDAKVPDQSESSLPEGDRAEVAAATDLLEQKLDAAEIRATLAAFDQLFDQLAGGVGSNESRPDA